MCPNKIFHGSGPGPVNKTKTFKVRYYNKTILGGVFPQLNSLVNLVDLVRELIEDRPGRGVLLLDLAELLGVDDVVEGGHLVPHDLGVLSHDFKGQVEVDNEIMIDG